MTLQNNLRKAPTGDEYTALEIADWLMQQHNAAASAGDKSRSDVIWGLVKEWGKDASID